MDQISGRCGQSLPAAQAIVIAVRLVFFVAYLILWPQQPLHSAEPQPLSQNMVLIPAGEFRMGSPLGSDSFPDEAPQRLVYLSAFLIDRHEVDAVYCKACGTKLNIPDEGRF